MGLQFVYQTIDPNPVAALVAKGKLPPECTAVIEEIREKLAPPDLQSFSMYARNVTSGVWRPKKNKGISALCYKAFCEENNRRTGGVSFIHVTGHSDDTGNDNADERVQWGKGDPPYCRFRSDGSSEGEYLDSPRPKDASVSPPLDLVHPSPSRRMRSAAWGAPFSSNLSTVRQRETDTPSSARSTSLDDDLRARVQSIQAPASSRRTLDFTNATPSPQCSSDPTGSLTGDSNSGDEDAAPTNYLSSPVLFKRLATTAFTRPAQA